MEDLKRQGDLFERVTSGATVQHAAYGTIGQGRLYGGAGAG